LKWNCAERQILAKTLEPIEKVPYLSAQVQCVYKGERDVGIHVETRIQIPAHQVELPRKQIRWCSRIECKRLLVKTLETTHSPIICECSNTLSFHFGQIAPVIIR